MMNKENRLEVETPVGKLIAVPSEDPDYPGICIFLERKDGVWIDLTCSEVEKESGEGRVFVWSDILSDDYTDVFRFNKKELLNEE